jgi:Pyridoxamine 5'-phosphate oxidase
VGSGDSTAGNWPPELLEVFERSITCEYASLTRSGTPVTVPTTPYVGHGTLDVSTGITYPAKAERARRNPKVALLFADPIGAGRGDSPVVLVQGHAAVRDADLQANTDRYARAAMIKLPEATKGQPKMLLRRLAFYYARMWVEITPLRIRRWPDRTMAQEPQQWGLEPVPSLPESDPDPAGKQPPAWKEAPLNWRETAASALRRLPLADLTVVDSDGYPLCLPVKAGELAGDDVPLGLGAGAPELSAGPACLTVHGHDEHFTKQENHTLVGELALGPDGPRLHVNRALASWSITGSRARIAVDFMKTGLRLRPRLKAEAARRGQPVPKVNLP